MAMARPTKSVEEKKCRTMGFRPSDPAEEQAIRKKIAASGLSASEYLRRAARRSQVVVRTTPGCDPELIAQLKRVGHNLNQLVKLAHSTQSIPAGLEPLCRQIESLVMAASEGAHDP